MDSNILNNRELYSEIIGSHARFIFVSEKYRYNDASYRQKYCERMWNLYSKNEKLSVRQFVSIFFTQASLSYY